MKYVKTILDKELKRLERCINTCIKVPTTHNIKQQKLYEKQTLEIKQALVLFNVSKRGKQQFYRIITPNYFSDLDAKDLDDAKKKLKDFGSTPENKEYYEYCQERMSQCRIVKVTEIVEDVNVC